MKFKVGQEVYWNDPDNHECSGFYTINYISDGDYMDDILFKLSNKEGSYIEAWGHELQEFHIDEDPEINWQNNDIQFPRLLTEIIVNLEISKEQLTLLGESMDLTNQGVLDIFERAINKYDQIKERL